MEEVYHSCGREQSFSQERADMTLSHERKRKEEAKGRTEEPGASARRPRKGRVKRPGTQIGWII